MAQHPTPTLSFGDPPPTYPFLDGTAIPKETAAEAMLRGVSVHVDTAEQATVLLEAVNLTPSQIAHRMAVADGSWGHDALQASDDPSAL